MPSLSVSSLNEQIKTLLETSFIRVSVEGEVSRITFHNSGHIYFTLKDPSSSIRAVMFRGNATKLKFRLEEGMKVVLDGAVTLYKPRGEYQINCFDVQPSGQGALALAFEQLKEKLSSKGYFDAIKKKQLPFFPKKIALITSSTGAALQDMIRVANSRYRAIELDLYDVLVQGEKAATDIVQALTLADSQNYDCIVIGRGGGSIEDLWAFNEEIVADAIYKSVTPIISAVGHEIDWVISDYVADIRAATPSAAMQIALPDTNELYQNLDSIAEQLHRSLEQKVSMKVRDIDHLKKLFSQHSIEKQIAQKLQELSQVKDRFLQTLSFKIQSCHREYESVMLRFPHTMNSVLNSKKNQLTSLHNVFSSNNPSLKSKRGFAQISMDKKIIDIDELHINDSFDLQSEKVYIHAKVLTKEIK